MMFKNITPIKVIILLAIFLSGCAVPNTQQINLLNMQEGEKTRQVTSSLGQRTFEVGSGVIIKALINAFANKNLTVLTVEKDAGFVMAEGANFLSNAQLLEVISQRRNRYLANSADGYVGDCIPNAKLKVTANIYSKAEKSTLIKININHSHLQPSCVCKKGDGVVAPFTPTPEIVKLLSLGGNSMQTACPVAPLEMASLWYQQLWDEIEKSIFMQRETILE
jgi:hypothetical protein